MTTTSIEWTDKTWNPSRGCSRVSPGCENCYAERQAARFSSAGQPFEGLVSVRSRVSGLRYTEPKAAGDWTSPRWAGKARFVREMLELPLRWRKAQRVFVDSMSDLFHVDITNEQIAAVFGVMAACPQHTFQVLTKRPERMLEWFNWTANDWDNSAAAPPIPVSCGIEAANHCADVDYLGLSDEWPLPNVWIGVSVEDQQRANERIPHLLDTPAAVRFISAEPLLAPIDLRRVRQDDVYSIDALTGDVREGTGANGTGFRTDRNCLSKLDWVIVGGESGPGARPCEVEWIRSVVKQCADADVRCFVKQLGARPLTFDAVSRADGSTELQPVYLRMRDKKGGEIRAFPEDLRVREFPR